MAKKTLKKKSKLTPQEEIKKLRGIIKAQAAISKTKNKIIRDQKKVIGNQSKALEKKYIPPAQPPLIDLLEKAIKASGQTYERGGWRENMHSVPPHDNCEWVDVDMMSKTGTKLTVHFYFTHDSTKLDKIQIFEAKPKTGFYDANRISE